MCIRDRLPRHQPAIGTQHCRGWPCDVEVAECRHRERVLVVAEGVCTDDGSVHAAVPALPDPPELVDDVVVADVAPAPGLRVIRVDTAHDRGHLSTRVAVACLLYT